MNCLLIANINFNSALSGTWLIFLYNHVSSPEDETFEYVCKTVDSRHLQL